MWPNTAYTDAWDYDRIAYLNLYAINNDTVDMREWDTSHTRYCMVRRIEPDIDNALLHSLMHPPSRDYRSTELIRKRLQLHFKKNSTVRGGLGPRC